MNKIIQIEGARNCGKTFLTEKFIENNTNYLLHKFPFVDYYNNLYVELKGSIDDKMLINNNSELYYFTLGNDLMLFDLAQKGLLKNDIIIDRGYMSNIVFGIQSGRIDYEVGVKIAKWINEKYKDILNIVFIKGNSKVLDTERNKDNWYIYNADQSNQLYENIFKDANIKYNKFTNNFDTKSIVLYENFIKEI